MLRFDPIHEHLRLVTNISSGSLPTRPGTGKQFQKKQQWCLKVLIVLNFNHV